MHRRSEAEISQLFRWREQVFTSRVSPLSTYKAKAGEKFQTTVVCIGGLTAAIAQRKYMCKLHVCTVRAYGHGCMRACIELGFAKAPNSDSSILVKDIKFNVSVSLIKGGDDRLDMLLDAKAAPANAAAVIVEAPVTWDMINRVKKELTYTSPSSKRMGEATCRASLESVGLDVARALPLDRLHLFDLGLCKVCATV